MAEQRLRLSSGCALTVLLCACQGESMDPTIPTTHVPISLARPQPPADTLVVTLNDAAGYRITSDGGGSYTNGVNGVSATLGSDLVMTTGPSRTMQFDFSVQMTGTPFTPNQAGRQSVGVTTQSPAPLNSMAVGTFVCSPLAFNWTGTYEETGVLFHSHAANTATDPSIYASVTRTSSSDWTIVSNDPACGANSDWALVRSGDATQRKITMVAIGYYSMPFSLQLHRK
jgi:hypothetical protein